MKQQKIILITVIVILIILNVLIVKKFKHIEQASFANRIKFENHITEIKSQSDELKSMILNNIHSESAIVSERLLIEELESKEVFTPKILTNSGPVLVLRISQNTCQVCIEQELKRMNEMSVPLIHNRFIILASYDNLRDLKLFQKENQINYPIYKIISDSLSIPLEKLSIPYFFVLDNSLKATNLFYPLMSTPDLTDKYFAILNEKFPILFK